MRHLRELLCRPAQLFDAYATMAALENLIDKARDHNAVNASRYATILRQIRPMSSNPTLQTIMLKLVGSDEDVAKAREIQKAIKSASTYSCTQAPSHGPNERRPMTCFNCDLRGHIARFCYKRPRGGQNRGRGFGRQDWQ